MKIGNRELTKENPYIIAEVGSNFRNDDDLFNSIHFAKATGADAVKFQFFSEAELYGSGSYERNFDPAIFPKLAKRANDLGIDLLCSAFSVGGIKIVNEFVPAHKIASCEMAHIRMLQAVKDTGKPLILSTGAYGLADVKKVMEFMGDYPVVLMHCNVAYPCNFVNTKRMVEILCKRRIVGYSDHTTSIDAVPELMKSLGASVYEKHYNPFDLTNTPDAPHSLNQEQFKTMVKVLRGEPLGYTEENEAKLKHIRRLIAIQDINPGDALVEGKNFGIFRSHKEDAAGLGPFFAEGMNGKSSKIKINAGDSITPQAI